MKKKMKACAFLLQAVILGANTLWVSPAAVTAQEKVTNVWGEVVDKPRYGGTITVPAMYDIDPEHCDPWHNWLGSICANPVLEKMGRGDWSVKREEFSFQSRFVPLSRATPSLAESYETPDALTIIYHIRKGVHWQDKPPMNGRELDANDVAYAFQRNFGLGDWKEQGPTKWGHMAGKAPVVSITATDKWTVVVKSTSYSPLTEHWLYFEGWEDSWVSPPEVLKQHGHHKDWKNTIGTGPFMITDRVEGSSLTYTKNPNYWATSQRYPGMRLPFVDELKLLIMKDQSTKIVALRTGKIDELLGVSFEQAEALEKSNPYLLKAVQKGVKGGDVSPTMNVTKPPFNDIRVRQAMQKALNLEEIAKGYYKGQALSVPFGIGGPSVVSEGYDIPFEEWPEDIKEGYRYDPEGAKRLLAEAGYPSGFEFTLDTAANQDNDIVQLAKAYWSQIGVTANINVMDGAAALAAKAAERKFDMVVWGSRGFEYHPFGRVSSYGEGYVENTSGWSDPHYDKLAHNFYNAPNQEALRKASVEASQYFVKAQINLALPSNHAFHFAQPWIKGGWWGQDGMGGGMLYAHFGRYWVDQDLKKQILGQ